MNHQLSFANDMPLLALYIAGVVVLIGVLLFAVQVKDITRKNAKKTPELLRL